jgi:MFS family permease
MSLAQKGLVIRRRDVPIVLTITLLVQTTVSLLAASVAVVAPAIAHGRGWNLSLIALYAPLLYIGAFSISFRVPWLLAKLGGMGVALCAVAFGATGLACLLSPSPAMAIVAALLIGASYGTMTPASSQILGPRTTPQNAGLIMSIKQVGVPMGAMLAGLILPYPVIHYGWQQVAATTAIASAVIAVALLPTLSWLNGLEATAPANFRPLDPVRRLLAIPGMTGVLVATLVYTAMQLCVRSLLTSYLVRDVGFGLGAAGLAFGVSQGAGMFGQVIWAWLSDRVMTPRTVLAAVGAVMCAGALATSLFSAQWSAVVIMIVAAILGFSAAGFIPVILGEVARCAPGGQVGAFTSGANLFIIAGAFLGPLVFGGIGSVLNYRAAFVVLAGGSAITATILMARRKPALADKATVRQAA